MLRGLNRLLLTVLLFGLLLGWLVGHGVGYMRHHIAIDVQWVP